MNDIKFVNFIRESDGARYQLGDRLIETDIEGAGSVIIETFTAPRGIGHGDIITGSRIAARELLIRSETLSSDDGTARREIDYFFRVNQDYRIEISYKGTTRWIIGRLTVIDMPVINIYAPQVVELQFICANPLFRGMDTFNKNIANITPMWGWPIYSPEETYKPDQGNPDWPYGLFVTGWNITGVYDFTKNVFATNDGEFPSPPRINVLAISQVENFQISKGNEEFLRVNTTMAQGDIMIIDFGAETVTLNGNNIISLVDKDSIFWQIDVGGSNISYTADVGENSLEVSVYYEQLYKVGI